VKTHWIRTLDDAKQVPESIWNEWATYGLIPLKVSLVLRSYSSNPILDSRLPCLPPSPRRRRSSSLLPTSLSVSASSLTTADTDAPTFMSSLLTLQSKLLEFAKGRVKTKPVSEDAEALASRFAAKMEVCTEGRWLPACTFRLVQSSRMRWSLTWWSVGREHEPPLGHIAVLSIAKVVRTENRTFLIKFRSFSNVEEITLRCEAEEEQVRMAKLLRNLIRETRMRVKNAT